VSISAPRRSRLWAAFAAGALVLAVGASAGGRDQSAGATARAWGVKVMVPGKSSVGTRVLSAPDDAVAFDGAFSYPADGSVVSAASVTASASASTGAQASASGSASIATLALFGGEVTAASLTGESHARAGSTSAGGDAGVSRIAGLTVLGRAMVPRANERLQLGDWGYAIALEQKGQQTASPAPAYHGFVIALDVFLTAAHGGLPAGSEIELGYGEAAAQAAVAVSPPTPSDLTTPPSEPTTAVPVSKPLTVTPPLGGTDYVFPVYGVAGAADTYGALRADVVTGWHHGDDLFAPAGTPALAVAHGVVFSVGWNEVGGWRLWLRDDHGNEFYYAHLSAYSPLAVDGAIVQAGDVLGFVGDSGDAEGTPPHLHFEVHPAGLLSLGYDGAVDPTTYLNAWRHMRHVTFDPSAEWTPPTPGARAPKAGAILLQSSDISSASGLDPESFARAIAGTPAINCSSRCRPGR
jgi:murein DD-endopeptidase MepM/ murein hydrolase activator NlpD